MEKYAITDVANDTLPIPVGESTLDTYGKDISGKTIDESVSIVFIM